MQTSTARLLRWLCLCLVMAGVAGTAQAQRTVTLRLNASTIPDTLGAGSFFEVRGALNGKAPATFPDGNVIDWSSASTLEPKRVAGDYWDVSFKAAAKDTIVYKFWSREADVLGLNTGWESGGDHKFGVPDQNVTRPVHFFNATGQNQPYDWRPWPQKKDSVAVWFRVFMNTENAVNKGYDPAKAGMVIGLRGSPDNKGTGVGGQMIDWGGAVPLKRESNDKNLAGYHLYSGALYFPKAQIGKPQTFKYYIDGIGIGDAGYEDGGDRRFNIPATDTTLHWVYFSNSKPLKAGAVRKTANVIFSVDVLPLEQVGVFSRARGDTMIVRGGFNGWGNCLEAGNPDVCSLFEQINGTFANAIPVTDFSGNEVAFKYFSNFKVANAPSGWEEPLDFGGGDRFFTFSGDNNQSLKTQFFNDIRQGNVIPKKDIEVTFQVDMRPARNFKEKPAFVAGKDQVWVGFEDPVWVFTQTKNKNLTELPRVLLTDPDGDMIYTGKYTVAGPTYNGIGYRYHYGDPNTSDVVEGEGGFATGRRRYQYVLPNASGAFPSAYTMPVVSVKEKGAMPFECNPTADPSTFTDRVKALCYPAGTKPVGTAIEVVDAELPSQIALGQNYPNPFNPATTFEYTLAQAQPVTVRIYDLMGRVVATLVDGMQGAATYRVTFDASHLASGVYLYQLETPTQVVTKKMTLIK